MVFDDQGTAVASFQNRITIEAPSADAAKQPGDLTYGFPVFLPPGLYHVRVGVRDEQSGRAGTAHSWIEIPNVGPGQLALSSVLMGVRSASEISNASTATPLTQESVNVSISHRFSPEGFLRFLVIIYNAALASADSQPDLAVQVQIIRDGQPVTTTPLKKISTADIQDLTAIPYAAELRLRAYPPGRYVLQVTVVDRVAKKSASQQTRFDIE